MPPQARLALCFFGLPRALPDTAPTIHAALIAPLRAQCEVTVMGHLFTASADHGETVPTDPAAHLPFDRLEREAPMACLPEWGFDTLKRHGDYWGDDFVSLRNLVHALHSLHRVTAMVQDAGIERCLFVRPDLIYHDSIAPHLPRLLHDAGPRVWLPHWQRWKGGQNDRFAFCTGAQAIAAYGGRARRALEFCRRTGEPLHSERLLAYALWVSGTPTAELPMRATRLRASGREMAENFAPRTARALRQRLRRQAGWLARGILPGRAGAA